MRKRRNQTLTMSANPFRKGDYVSFAGDDQWTRHRVKRVTSRTSIVLVTNRCDMVGWGG